jgi:endonuclease YncB( thermonuclease family)
MLRLPRIAAVAQLAIGTSMPGNAGNNQVIVGTATVIDGDTLRLDGQRIRLTGIDAPELHQLCTDHGRSAPCGERSKGALVRLIRTGPVSCTGDQRDRYGRLLAVCTVAEQDIGAAMVRAGQAIAYRRYSTTYVPEEDEARSCPRVRSQR